jgi:hypothetical protein
MIASIAGIAAFAAISIMYACIQLLPHCSWDELSVGL